VSCSRGVVPILKEAYTLLRTHPYERNTQSEQSIERLHQVLTGYNKQLEGASRDVVGDALRSIELSRNSSTRNIVIASIFRSLIMAFVVDNRAAILEAFFAGLTDGRNHLFTLHQKGYRTADVYIWAMRQTKISEGSQLLSKIKEPDLSSDEQRATFNYL